MRLGGALQEGRGQRYLMEREPLLIGQVLWARSYVSPLLTVTELPSSHLQENNRGCSGAEPLQ